jgi:hypothetical protein
MKKENTVLKVENRLAALRLQEQKLQEQMKETGLRIREGATPVGLLKMLFPVCFRIRTFLRKRQKPPLV